MAEVAGGRRASSALRWLGPLAGVVLFLAAAVVIADELRAVRWRDVAAAADATSPTALALALLALFGSLLAASTYDALSLAALGRPASWRATAVTSAAAFALANAGPPGVGLAGGVRFRAYQGQGLTGRDVALLSGAAVIVALLGGLVLVSTGVTGGLQAAAAEAHLPRWTGLMLGVFGLKALATGLAAPRIGWLNRVLPGRRVRLGMVAASAAEWTAAAALLWVLLPEHSRGGLLHFLPVFGMAGLLGALSGLPGGIGPFDAIIIAVVGPRAGAADTAAALLLYRAIYVVGPLLVAAAVSLLLTMRGRASAGRALQAGQAVWRELAPPLFSLLVFASGVVTLLSAATPEEPAALRALEAVAPAGLVDLSHLVASLVGVALLFLSFGLYARLRRAWAAVLLALAAAAVACLLKGLGVGEAVFLAAVAALLGFSREAFDRRAGWGAAPLTPRGAAAILTVLIAAGGLGLFAYRDVAYRDDLWWTFVIDDNAPRFLRASVAAAGLALLLFAWRFSRPQPAVPATPADEDIARAAAILAAAEDASPDANLVFLRDKVLMFTPSGRSFIQYGVRGRSWIAMGEPVGPREERRAAVWTFRELCDRHGATPVFYAVRREWVPDFVDCGLAVSKIGETALVDIADFSLEGGARANLRHAVNRGRREGLAFEIIPPEGFGAACAELRDISDQWLEIHHGVEKGFSLGRFDPHYLRRFPTAVLRQEGRIVAFANLWRTPDGRTLSVDLMRHGAEAPRNSMDVLFVELILWGRANGFEVFDLGMAPLSGLEAHRQSPWLARVGSLVYAGGGGVYGFEGLRAFKDKFGPRWEAVYIAAPTGWMLLPALADAALLSSGGLLGALR